MEHMLASLARIEARLEAAERGAIGTVPPPRLDPESPSSGPPITPVYMHAIGVSSRSLLGELPGGA